MTEQTIVILAIVFVVVVIYMTNKSVQENNKTTFDSLINDDIKIKGALTTKIQEYEKLISEKDHYIRQKAAERQRLEEQLKKATMDTFFQAGDIEDLKKQIANLTQLNTSLQSKLQSHKTAPLAVKKCPACRRVQPINEFGKNANQPDGLTKWCSLCMAEGAPMPHDMSGMKICEKCGQNRKKSSFYPSSRYADGLSKWCKFCLDSK